MDGPARPGAGGLTLATFNIHAGVDGWGRPYDVAASCAALDADVIVLQESWADDDGSPSTAGRVAAALGYQVVAEETLATGQLFAPVPDAPDGWGPVLGQVRKAFRLDGEGLRGGDRRGDGEDPGDRAGSGDGDGDGDGDGAGSGSGSTRRGGPARSGAARSAVRGTWGVALLSRVPVTGVDVLPLGRLSRDPARRVVLRATVPVGGGELVVCGTHMSHITHGSHLQYRTLSGVLPDLATPAVLAGDMNLWGRPTLSYLRGWRRAVRGRSWPANRPHSQLDHILVTEPVAVVASHIADFSGSDHRPAVATLALR